MSGFERAWSHLERYADSVASVQWDSEGIGVEILRRVAREERTLVKGRWSCEQVRGSESVVVAVLMRVVLPKIANMDVRRGPGVGKCELRGRGWRGTLGPVWYCVLAALMLMISCMVWLFQ